MGGQMNKGVIALVATVGLAVLAWHWLEYSRQECCAAPLAVAEEDIAVESKPEADEAGAATVTSPRAEAEAPVPGGVQQAPLDLSLPPEAVVSEDFPGDEATERYGVGQWFEGKPKEESRLKFKSKIHLKEEAGLESGLDNYDKSIEGAEMGFEYKTR